MGDKEDEFMWQHFAPESCDLAIQCTIGSFIASAANDSRVLICRKINYGDHAKDFVRPSISRAMFKGAEKFEPEHELRFILDGTPYTLNLKTRTVHDLDPDFRLLSVDLNTLIDKIVISPKATKDDFTTLDAYLKANKINRPHCYSILRPID